MAVAASDRHRSIGIDAERLDRPIEPDLVETIAIPAELSEAMRATAHPAHLVLSAKEAYFKVYHPVTRAWSSSGTSS